jgi:pimeloyl-ACP methyl ester carboxylesterase
MSALGEATVTVNGHACRVLSKGTGPRLGYLAGLVGVPKWTPFLDALSERFEVVVPSLPGFPGATGYEDLDDILDWISAALDLIEGAGLFGAPLVGNGPGAMLAAEIAAVSPGAVSRLVLMSPFGLFEDADPVPHLWANRAADAQKLMAERQDELAALLEAPEGADRVEWSIAMARSSAAAGRMLWPTCDRGLAKRLHRIKTPALVMWGAEDRVVPPSYLAVFAARMGRKPETLLLAGTGHLIDLDAPAAAAEAVRDFIEGGQRQAA